MSIEQSVPEMRPLQFGIRRGSHDYTDAVGQYAWSIGLPDRREAYVHADRIEITPAGVLIAWCETKVTKRDKDRCVEEREPEEQPYPTLILAAGAWCHCTLNSAWTGEPISIIGLADPDDL